MDNQYNGKLKVCTNRDGDLYLKLPDSWKKIGFKDGDELPVKMNDHQMTIDFRKVVGRFINSLFEKGPCYSESDMKRKFAKDGW